MASGSASATTFRLKAADGMYLVDLRFGLVLADDFRYIKRAPNHGITGMRHL
jgi:ribulose 1,5-bisphosphate carboxylase large subunit-like protein